MQTLQLPTDLTTIVSTSSTSSTKKKRKQQAVPINEQAVVFDEKATEAVAAVAVTPESNYSQQYTPSKMFIEALDLTVKNASPLTINRICSPVTQRPAVFLGKVTTVGGGARTWKHVTTEELFREFLSSIEHASLVTGYAGADKDKITVYDIPLPEGYICRAAYCQLKHIPSDLIRGGDVRAQQVGPKDGPKKLILTCKEMAPVWSHTNGVPGYYARVTIKLRNDDGKLFGWNPGHDIASVPLTTLGDAFVLVGKSHDDMNRANLSGNVAPQSAPTESDLVAEAFKNDAPI